jgi:hypothetical protein
MFIMQASLPNVRQFWVWGMILSFSLLGRPACGEQTSPAGRAINKVQAAAQRLPAKVNTSSGASESSKGKHQAASRVAGVALSLSGTWEMYLGDRVQTLKQGDAIPDGWSLRPLSEGASAKIVLTDGRTLTCPGGAACAKPITLSRSQSQADGWLPAAIAMFVQKPDQWVVLQSRGEDIAPQDSVLKAGEGRIDLTSACQGIPNGTYYLRIRSAGASANQRLGPEQITIADTNPVIVAAPNLTPGLYIVNISANKEEPSATQAWVLLSDARSYDRQLGTYLKAVKASSTLSPELGVNKVKELLRAYMASLSEGIQ